MRGYQVPVQRF